MSETYEAELVSCNCGSWLESDSEENRCEVPVASKEIYEEVEACVLLKLDELISIADVVVVVLVEALRKLLLDREGQPSRDPRWDEASNDAQELSRLLREVCNPDFEVEVCDPSSAA